MTVKNILEVNAKIDAMNVVKEEMVKFMPKTIIAKAKFAFDTKKRIDCIRYFDKALALSNERDVYMPDDNYILMLDGIRIIERGIRRQREILSLCVHANCMQLNERTQAEFDYHALDNDKDKCVLILSNEQHRMNESDRVARHMLLRIEKPNKEIAEIEALICQWLDEDGRPRFKNVNIGNMNSCLAKLYPRDSIIAAYKQFLDTEPYNALMRAIERDLKRRGL